MPSYVALLGGINLGRRRLTMDELRRHFAAIGLTDVQTLLASGNVLFSASRQSGARLESQIEQHLAGALNYTVTTYVRTASEVAAVLEQAAASAASARHPASNLQVVFFKEALARGVATKVIACGTARESFVVSGRELYWLLDGKSSESQIWQSREMKAAALPVGTMRKLNTVKKIAARLANSAS